MSDWRAIEQAREGIGSIHAASSKRKRDGDAALSVVEEALEAAAGVMTQMDYETPHHTRLRAALARAREGIKP